MSARMEKELKNLLTGGREAGRPSFPVFFEARSVLSNLDRRNVVTALREAQNALANGETDEPCSAEQLQLGLRLQGQWHAWLAERESLQEATRRGREYLEETRQELGRLRERLEQWREHERACGQNPLPQDLEAVEKQERVAEFLPGWLKRREEELVAVNQKIARCAREQGLEHLV